VPLISFTSRIDAPLVNLIAFAFFKLTVWVRNIVKIIELNPSKTPKLPVMLPTDPQHQTSSPDPFSSYRRRQHNHLQNFINSTIEINNIPLRHLASQSTLTSSNGHQRPDAQSTYAKTTHFNPSSLTFDDQRVDPPRGFSITKSTKLWDPTLSTTTSVPILPQSRLNSLHSNANRLSRAESSFGGGGFEKIAGPSIDRTVGEEDESIYPNSLELGFLILGLCLSVFLISLDRTIITTVSNHQSVS